MSKKGNIVLMSLLLTCLHVVLASSLKDSSDALYQSGREHFLRGEFKVAQTDLFQAFKIRKTIYKEKDPQYEEVLYSIGELFYEAGNLETAERILQNDLDIVQRHWGKNSLQYAHTIEKLGLVALENDNYEAAENFLRSANGLYEKLEGKKSLSYAQNLLYEGQLFAAQGYFTAAEALYRQARFILKKSANKNDLVYSKLLLLTGELYAQLHNYVEALEQFNELIALNQKLYGAEHPFISKAHFHLGKIFLQSGYLANAQPHVFAAYQGFVKYYGANHLKTLLAKSVVAAYYNRNKQFAKSDSVYTETLQALEFYADDKHIQHAKVESGLASLYYNMGQYENAIDMHQRSLEVIKEFVENSHPFYIQTINDLSFLDWASGKNLQADRLFEESTTNYINQFNRYFAFLSEQEKGFFYHDIRLFFDKYNSYILSRAKQKPSLICQMYDNQLATKALLFHTTQEIRKQVMQSNDKSLQGKYANWVQMKEHLSKLYKLVEEDDSEENRDLLDSLEERATDLEKEISLRIELGKNKKGTGLQEYTWKDIQKVLKPEEAAVEIIRVQEFVSDSGGRFTEKVHYVALIITPETKKHPDLIRLENGKQLETKYLKYYRNSIQHKITDQFSYLMFWKPIKESKHLKNSKKLYISCDGVFNQINLNTLIHPETQQAVFDEMDIHLLTNTKDIIRLKTEAKQTNQQQTILFGYPDYYKSDIASLQQKNVAAGKSGETRHVIHHTTRGHHDFKDISRGGKIVELPGTKQEVEEVSRIFKDSQQEAKVYLGEKANETELKSLDNPAVLHIATHGFFMPDLDAKSDSTLSDSLVFESFTENPLTRSGIMLVGAGHAYSDETLEREFLAVQNAEKFEDGILTAYEAMNINLMNTDLVILSACETGLGEVKNGEGVYGLQRSLQTAGAKSVVMSLWKVSDQATKELMVNFYGEWVKTHDKRQAFRSAQAKLRQSFPDPIYWGAFVMVGE
jgi:CHAT domain-containing protein